MQPKNHQKGQNVTLSVFYMRKLLIYWMLNMRFAKRQFLLSHTDYKPKKNQAVFSRIWTNPGSVLVMLPDFARYLYLVKWVNWPPKTRQRDKGKINSW